MSNKDKFPFEKLSSHSIPIEQIFGFMLKKGDKYYESLRELIKETINYWDSDYEDFLRKFYEITYANFKEIKLKEINPVKYRKSLESEFCKIIENKIRSETYDNENEKEERGEYLKMKKDDFLDFIFHRYINFYEKTS